MDHYYRDNRAWVKGLAMGCPFGDPRPDCPLEAMRKLSPAERLNRVNDMTDDELAVIVSHHKECLSQREAELME